MSSDFSPQVNNQAKPKLEVAQLVKPYEKFDTACRDLSIFKPLMQLCYYD